MKRNIAIIGAGAAGTNLAIVLALCAKKFNLDWNIEIFEQSDDILLGGASKAVNIAHETGSEYCHPRHRKTGEQCIEGALTSRLFYKDAFGTDICTPDNPMLFLVSKDTLTKGRSGGRFDKMDFSDNAAHMTAHFKKLAEHIIHKRQLTAPEEQIRILGCLPDAFITPLQSTDNHYNPDEIVGGHRAKGDGVNMRQYYETVKQSLQDLDIQIHYNCNVQKIVPAGGFKYHIETEAPSSTSTNYDQIVVATSHNIPQIHDKMDGPKKAPPEGTYYLNGMLYVSLPPTTDPNKIKQLRRVYFTLQADEGCMFACTKLPTATEAGRAAIYFPSTKGNQLAQCTYSKDSPQKPPQDWEDIIKKGLQATDPEKYTKHTDAILAQAHKLYPFLQDYVTKNHIIEFPCRTVFNLGTKDSDAGKERRVRQMGGFHPLSINDCVIALHSPKWTNATLSAFTAASRILSHLSSQRLPTDEKTGFGPFKLDMEQITSPTGLNMNIDAIHVKGGAMHAPQHDMDIPSSTIQHVAQRHHDTMAGIQGKHVRQQADYTQRMLNIVQNQSTLTRGI